MERRISVEEESTKWESANKCRTILMPIDGSDYSRNTFQWFLENIYRVEGDRILFVHVVEPIVTPMIFKLSYKSAVLHAPENMVGINMEESKRIGREYTEKAKRLGIVNRMVIHLSYTPGEELVTSAVKNNVKLIVMSNRGQGRFRRTMLGGVTDYVIQHSHIPVVIVPSMLNQKHQKQEEEKLK